MVMKLPATLPAWQHFEQGDIESARQACLDALARDANLAPALELLGILALQAGRPTEAIPHLVRALQINPGNMATMYNLG
jgi:tetratricopeptide (TPR) repeat protein